MDHLFTPRVAVASLVLLLVFIALGQRRTAQGQFEYYVFDPMPDTVRNVQFHGDSFRINPEPLCFIRFTASPADIDSIVKRKNFKAVENSFDPTGPPWWDVSTLTNVRVFTRQHRPRETKLFFGKNRGWTEVLRIDSTGTNAYFLVWGI